MITLDTQPKQQKGEELTNPSKNTAEEYESLVQQEDEHIERLKHAQSSFGMR